MLTSIPQSVRRAWGDEAAEDFTHWFDKALHEHAVPRDEYRKVLSRLDVIERDVTGIKQEQVELRRETGELRREMNERFDQMHAQFNERFDQMHAQFDGRFAQMNVQFDGRFAQIDGRFAQLDARLDKMNERFDRLTRWAIGLLALFATIITALLAVAQFTS